MSLVQSPLIESKFVEGRIEKYPFRGGLFKADPGVKGVPAYFYNAPKY